MSDSNPIDGSPIGALAEMFSNLTVAASKASERADILRLARKKVDLARLVNLLKSTRRYISRSDRNLMVRALLFYQRRHSVDVSTAVRSLLASTKYPIPKEIRDCISLLISKLLTDYTSELCGVRPENDEERFDAMIEDNNLASGVWRDMQAMGIVLCHVMPTTRKMDLLGTKRRDEFFSEFDSRWGFENSSKYIIYTGEASVPVGKTDSADAHVIAGSTLNTIIPLVDGYDLRNGTVGGVFYTEENETMYVVTAGHCVLMKSSTPERLAEQLLESEVDDATRIEQNRRAEEPSIIISDNFDYAILPLKKLTNGVLGFNPWYMDDDISANEEFFLAEQR